MSGSGSEILPRNVISLPLYGFSEVLIYFQHLTEWNIWIFIHQRNVMIDNFRSWPWCESWTQFLPIGYSFYFSIYHYSIGLWLELVNQKSLPWWCAFRSFLFFYNRIATVIMRMLEQCHVERKGPGSGLLPELHAEACNLYLKQFLTLMWFILHRQSFVFKDFVNGDY